MSLNDRKQNPDLSLLDLYEKASKQYRDFCRKEAELIKQEAESKEERTLRALPKPIQEDETRKSFYWNDIKNLLMENGISEAKIKKLFKAGLLPILVSQDKVTATISNKDWWKLVEILVENSIPKKLESRIESWGKKRREAFQAEMNIYKNHSQAFENKQDTCVIKLITLQTASLGHSYEKKQSTRIFSLRGALKVVRYSDTKVSDEIYNFIIDVFMEEAGIRREACQIQEL